jgi:hypothetical protein
MFPVEMDDGQTAGIFDGQGAQANRVDQLKNGGVRANAERERKNGYCGEARRLPQNAKAVANVLKQLAHHPPL